MYSIPPFFPVYKLTTTPWPDMHTLFWLFLHSHNPELFAHIFSLQQPKDTGLREN
jgi:hypothetical protein